MKRVLVILMMICLMASSLPVTSAGASDDIPTNAAATGDHDTLVAALSHVGLVATLQSPGPFTVFAPTDEAFANAGIDIADFDTQEEKDRLTDILTYHVIDGEVPSSAVTDGMTATMVNGDTASFTVADGKVSIGDASVTLADVPASNGVIHVIDTVLMPPMDITEIAQSTGIHNALVAAIVQADLLSTLQGNGPFTVFAPTDQAFTDAQIDLNALDTPEGKDALTNILLYHVVDGEVPSSAVTDCLSTDAVNSDPLSFSVGDNVMVNDAIVTAADVTASNGVIHVIDKVLTPTKTPRDIPRTAQCTGVHNSLVDAVIQAELLTTLQGPGPFTLFAPTDQAFTDANIDLADFDTPEGKASLANILQYHLISGEVMSGDLTDGMVATAVNGDELTVDLTSGVKINEATVTSPDVATSNGVIHVIDKVLMPPVGPLNIPATAANTGIHNTLVQAITQADLLSTLEGDGPFTVFAPTDQAFSDANIDLAALDTPEGKTALTEILQYHVVSGSVASSALTDCMEADSITNQPLSFTVDNGVMVNDANVILADQQASNGIIHVIDKVLSPDDTLDNIPRTAHCTGMHNSLVSAIIQADLLSTLEGDGPFTVFAPTDMAFAQANIDLVSLDTPEGKATLSDILLYHVVSGEVPSSAVTDCMSADSANEKTLSFTVDNGVMVNDANVITPDVTTSNGIIHVIDKVLMPTDTPNDIPATARCTGIHDSLVAAVLQADLLETLQGEGPFTVFAPTDQAFIDANIDLADLDTPEGKEILSNILQYHVVSGSVASSTIENCATAQAVNDQSLAFTVGNTVMVNDANVISADVATSNGVIHVIDKVLTPTSTPNNIPTTAGCTGVHNSFVAAVIQAELLSTLEGEGPFTVFAPTDQAFTDAGIDLTALNTPEGKEILTNILLHHVYQGSLASSDITDGLTRSMVNGDDITFTLVDGKVMIGESMVQTADVATSNGVIHVVDKVIMPPEETTGATDDTESSSDDESSNVVWIALVIILLIGGGAGGLLFVRSRKESTSKDFASVGGLLNQLQPVDTSAYQPQTQQTYQPQAQQQSYQPVQTVEVVQQPVAVEPTILRQWTDAAGYTWRAMDDGNTYWWTGAEWQKYG